MKFKYRAILRVVASAGILLGAAHAQAQSVYNVNYSQSFAGLLFGSPATATVSGAFSATDANSDGRLSSADGEINLASFSFNLSGDLGDVNYSGAQVDSVDIVWVVGDNNLSNVLSGVDIIAAPGSGAGFQWQAGAVAGVPAPGGLLYAFNNLVFPVTGFDPANATGAAAFSSTVTPIPEPQTYLMMLAGIAGLAAFARRRAQ